MKNITFNAETCKGCELCIDVCPKKIIILDKDKINKNGHHPAAVKDPEACISCGQCYIICPQIAVKIEK
ncbi:MAG: 4Fe-4S dicluster domain-containing protein [Oscillospiraceae bacterium]|nr:4Fe-4S dicluster domain-containing protein [Oscillospiraceae bacterium]